MAAPGRLTARQVNLVLEALVVTAVASGLASWTVGDRWNGWFVAVHGLIGLSLLVLAPAKLRGSVRTGFRRRRSTRWLSAGFGVLVLATVALGVLHATGVWFAVGYWSALWTHTLFGVVVVPLLLWHVTTRPVRPRPMDLDRRALLRSGLIGAVAAAVYLGQESLTRWTGLAGGTRRSTGSHEVASFQPSEMPAVIWFDDSRPAAADGDPDDWPLMIAGARVSVASLRRRALPVVATLDCTGGWFSEQSWDAVALSELLGPATGTRHAGRSVRVTSVTGYDRLFALDVLDRVYLAVGYGGEPLQAKHGAPVRLVVPGRRGPWWVKWVTSVEPDDRPSWLQSPLPAS